MRYHSFAGISPARPSAQSSFCNLSATQMPGCGWHGKGPVASRRGTHHARRVCAYSCGWRSCPSGRQRATEATELTEPTDRRPVMKRLSHTTVSCGTLPLSRVCGWGSRPGRGSPATGSRTGRGRRGGCGVRCGKGSRALAQAWSSRRSAGLSSQSSSSCTPVRAASSASRASPRIHQIIARAATGSAHHQPSRSLRTRPASSTADM